MRRPPLARALSEPLRASGEFATSLGLLPFMSLLPQGDGHPVLVLPGFMASDRSTGPLRRLLRALGYDTHAWGLGPNLGPTERVVAEMPDLAHRIAQRSGRAVSVVGWSLGGVYARYLAARTPESIRTVVTLGTPVRTQVKEASNASAMFDALKAIHVPGHPMLDEGQPLDVPVTAVHTRSDGIVHWKTCMIEDAPNAENLRVSGSHTGLGYNPAVAYIVTDRLAQAEGEWKPLAPPTAYRRVITRVLGS